MAKRWVQVASAGLALALILAIAALSSLTWEVGDPTRRALVLDRVAASSGLRSVAGGAIRLRLLPLPSIEIHDIDMTGLDGAVRVQADVLAGRLGLGGLLRGRWTVSTVTLDRPTIVLDMDRLTPLVSAMLAAAQASPGEPQSIERSVFAVLRTDGVGLRAGVVRLLSSDAQRDTLLSDVTGTFAWPGGAGDAEVGGRANWRGVPATFSAVLDTPSMLSSGGSTDGSLRLRSPVLDLSLNGAIVGGAHPHAEGRLSASTIDLRGFLRALDTPVPQLGAFREASLSAEASLSPERLALSAVQLGLGDMSFEGAMVVHDNAGRPALAGTLATERIDLNPFLAALPPLDAPDTAWSAAPLPTRSVADDDIDLRISASKARIGSLAFEDGSLSLQSGHGRMELSVGEARAYDGLLKGRVVATIDGDITEVRGDVSVSRLDLARAAREFSRSTTLEGSATGHLMLESRGRSYAELIQALAGQGQVSVRNGAAPPRLVAATASVRPESGAATTAALDRLASFDSASAALSVSHGTVSLRDGRVIWPDVTGILTGEASIPLRRLDGRIAMEPPADGSAPAAEPASIALSGPWRDLSLSATPAGPPIVGDRAP